jgi:BirA family biotin operon repressor/biotin-[acetyl-CoA-carboxylase] ligase
MTMTQYTLEAHETCASTMDLAQLWIENIHSFGENFHVIWALEQTAGRGKLDRQWLSLKGNLFSTLVIPFYCSSNRVGELSFLAALSVAEAINSLDPQLKVLCKWPNDIVINDKKVGGILLEVLSKGTKNFVSIGIGLNLKSFPEEVISTSLSELGIHISPKEMLEKILKRIARFLDVWYAEGFEPIRTLWHKRAWNLGEQLKVKTFSKEIIGTFELMDHAGCLILIQEDGRRARLASGDVLLTRRND